MKDILFLIWYNSWNLVLSFKTITYLKLFCCTSNSFLFKKVFCWCKFWGKTIGKYCYCLALHSSVLHGLRQKWRHLECRKRWLWCYNDWTLWNFENVRLNFWIDSDVNQLGTLIRSNSLTTWDKNLCCLCKKHTFCAVSNEVPYQNIELGVGINSLPIIFMFSFLDYMNY